MVINIDDIKYSILCEIEKYKARHNGASPEKIFMNEYLCHFLENNDKLNSSCLYYKYPERKLYIFNIEVQSYFDNKNEVEYYLAEKGNFYSEPKYNSVFGLPEYKSYNTCS